MAYKNFIPEIWAEAINRELERMHVFAADCNREYEGSVAKKGDSVRILGVGSPTITTYNDKNEFTALGAAETVEDTSVTMTINQLSTFNYKVDDIDKRQAVGGLMEALAAETSEKLANVQDKYIANMAADKLAKRMWSASKEVTADNILDCLLEAHQMLMENDVSTQTKVIVTLNPRLATLYKKAMSLRDTDNSDLLKNGLIDRFDGMDIKVSNNVCRVKEGSVTSDLIQVKTQRAIAFARPMIHTEPYRPENGFSDAVKGFILYDAKIVRPKEMFVMNVKIV